MDPFYSDHFRPRSALLGQWQAYADKAVLESAETLCNAANGAADLIASKKMLKLAWDWQKAIGGPAAGPNGLHFGDFSRLAAWKEINRLHDQLTSGRYRHGGVRHVDVPKGPGKSGTRRLSIPDVQDRVVGRALVLTLEPLLSPRFDERSFCRFARGVGHAVAQAKCLAEQQGRWTWIGQDIRGAFDHVPIARLITIIERYLPSGRLLDLLRRCVDDSRAMGLYQGAPLSPLLMNLYLHHLIDQPWRQQHPDVPLLRYMDDLLVLCGRNDDAERLHEDLAQLAESAALKLSIDSDRAIRPLHCMSADWLGFRFRQAEDGLDIHLPFIGNSKPARQWRSDLGQRFVDLHARPDAPEAARQMITGVVAWAGPTLPWSDTGEVYEILRKAARSAAFEEIPSRDAVERLWRRRHDAWQRNCVRPMMAATARQLASVAADDEIRSSQTAPF